MRDLAMFMMVVIPTLSGFAQTALAPAVKEAWDVLDKSLAGNSDHRQEALASIATIALNDREAVQRARTALADKDSQVRVAAALALGELRGQSAIPDLTKALDDSAEVSFAAAQSLTQLGDPAGREVLIAVLNGDRKDAPGIFGSAARKAKDKMHHPEGLLLMGARDATGAMFGPVSFVIPVVKDTIELRKSGTPGRAVAVAYLARYPDANAIQLLEWALGDESRYVRLEAAKELGERGNSASIAKLEPVLRDEHTMIRDMAAASIIRINDRGGAAGEVSSAPVTQPVSNGKGAH
jgi:HEAT repeat protein